ncbi:hypothetical protein PVK06_005275 [Gossypium arboreum]|uniref:Uncharacterized protein n=1 Tax=Gossypium arboreum TaxID=29729 RepID=A0ABR0QU67_GOSAR|nr:hypothetical protein PVK06_005275 [Gossypium arboreum]
MNLLKDNFKELPEDPKDRMEEVRQQYARAYIMSHGPDGYYHFYILCLNGCHVLTSMLCPAFRLKCWAIGRCGTRRYIFSATDVPYILHPWVDVNAEPYVEMDTDEPTATDANAHTAVYA